MFYFVFLDKQKKCVISVCAKTQHRAAEPPAPRLSRAHLGHFPHPCDFAFAFRKGQGLKLKACLSVSAVPGYRNM